MSRISSGVSRQLRVYDTKAYHQRKWDFGIEHGFWLECTKHFGRGSLLRSLFYFPLLQLLLCNVCLIL